MKKIHIFLASSLVEFQTERMAIENFIRNISDKFEDSYHVKIQPVLCENLDDAYSTVRKQEEYNQKIRESDFCFFIFYTRVGQYTREEFEVAAKQFATCQKPKIYVYFKTVAEGEAEKGIYAFMEELDKVFGHYYGTFDHIDTVKLRILLSLKLQEMDFLELKTEDGSCTVDGTPVLSLEHVAEFANNQSLAKLQKELLEIEDEYFRMKPIYQKGNCDEAFFKRYSYVASRRQTLQEEIDELQRLIFTVSLRMIEDDVRGTITPRQKEAYRLFELGDYEGCLAVLDASEIDNDFLRERNRIKAEEVAVCKKYIREHKTAIDILHSMTEYQNRFSEIENRYQKIIPLILELGIELSTGYEYLSYLYRQNHMTKAVELAEQLLPLVTDREMLGDLWNLSGVIFHDSNQPKKAEEFYQKAMEIYESLANENPERFLPDLAKSYNNAGVFYDNQGKPKLAEEFFQKAIEIRESLANENPERFLPDLAKSYNNAGIFYKNQGKPKLAEEFYQKAIEIRESLAKENPDRFLPNLATSYNNAGIFYKDQGKPKLAEEFYQKAIAIRESLAKENPDRFLPDLAISYNNAGNFYKNHRNPKLAEEFYQKAMEIYESLAKENPGRFLPDLADTYNNAGNFYDDQGKSKLAEEFYQKAMEIYESLAKENPERFLPDLAMSYNNAGVFYDDQGKAESAEEFYQKAMKIYESLAKENPQRFLPDLAMSYNNAGVFYDDQGKAESAEEFYQKAMEIYESLAKENPQRFLPDLAMSYNNAGAFYYDQGKSKLAEEFYQKAMEIYESLAKENPDRFLPDLAMSYFNYGLFTQDSAWLQKALELAKQQPDHYICRQIISRLES